MVCLADRGQTGLGKNFSQSQVETSLMAWLQGEVHERVGGDCAHFLLRSTAMLSLEQTDEETRNGQKMHIL